MTTPFMLGRVRVPASLLDAPPGPVAPDNTVLCNIVVQNGIIADITPPDITPGAPEVHDQQGRILLPLFTDIHTHIDKTFIWERTPNPDGTFAGALGAVAYDRDANWTPDDVAFRMDFALRCAFAHGTRRLRTHLDTMGAHGDAVWPLFRRVQAEWAGRIDLQATALVMLERYAEPGMDDIARAVAQTPGGQLGAVIMHHNVTPERLDLMVGMAAAYGLDLDLHVDENGFADGTALELIAQAVMRHSFRGRVLCGHCCSLSRQTPGRQRAIIAQVADAGLGIVSLPTCNLYLQDRQAGATPHWRGVTLVHELAAAGVPVMYASDNVRDPFYAYGDYDMLDILAQSIRIAHLDTPFGAVVDAVTAIPAQWCGASARITRGAAADLMVLSGRTMNEVISRPGAPRRVLRDGRWSDAQAPDYRDLDARPGLRPQHQPF